MVKSMTGYGRGEAVLAGRSITVEVRSVNNRYLDCSVKMPRLYIFAEESIKSRVQKAISRGKVDVFVTLESLETAQTAVSVNEPLARSYMAALKTLIQMPEGEGMVKGKYSAADLARLPDVLTIVRAEEDVEAVAQDICTVLDAALESFTTMRTREGERLAQDIHARAQTILGLVERVEKRSPETVNDYRTRLENKMREVLENTQLDESRILTEAAIFADKVAVDEETVRLRSHISQLEEMLESGVPIGRKLDFLLQEFNREANTIGSKCTDLEISRYVVDIKAEIEKIREQVQNVE